MTPTLLIQKLPTYLAWAPGWLLAVLVVALLLLLTLAAYEGAVRLVRHGLRRRSAFLRSLLVRTRGPARLALCVLALSWGVRLAPFTDGQGSAIQHALLIAMIVLAGWALMTATDIGSALYMQRFRMDVADNLLARKHLTQVRILKRAAATLIMVLTAGLALMTLPAVRQLGMSLLAAGGAAGIIVGLALQPILSNVMAGVQIALTQPIRLDDAVVINNEFGNVEEINSTYVVIRLWDLRRLVVPLKYFLEQPFQNWTRQSAEMLGTVLLYLDYRTPTEPLRRRLTEILKASPLWDGKVNVVQVTDARERTVEVRCLVSAADSGRLFDLRCEVREKMIAYLQAEFPQALPRDRLEFQGPEEGFARSGAGAGPGDQRVQ